MDPIMKLLEEDEDEENMHSGAAVEAFTAALNRDIEGGNSTLQPADSDGAAVTLPQGSTHASNQLFPRWQTSSFEENSSFPSEQGVQGSQMQEQHSSVMDMQQQHGPVAENQKLQNETPSEMSCLPLQQNQNQDDFLQHQVIQNSHNMSQSASLQNAQKNADTDPQFQQRFQRMNNQQAAMATRQVFNMASRGKQVPFALLLPVIEPQLEKDRAMQLQNLYNQLKQNNISKEEFVRHLRTLVGDHMLKMAVVKVQTQVARNSQNAPNQSPLPSQASAKLSLQKPPANSPHVPSSGAQSAEKNNIPTDGDGQRSRMMAHQSDSHGMQVSQISSSNQERESPFPIQGLTNQQQQHLHFSQASFPTYGSNGSNYVPYPGTNINSSTQSLKQHPHDLQMRQNPAHRGMGTNQLGTTTQVLNSMSAPNFERHGSLSDLKRGQGGAPSHLTSNPSIHQSSGQLKPSIHKESHMSGKPHIKQEPSDQTNEQQKSQLPAPSGLPPFSGKLEQGTAVLGTKKDEPVEIQSSRMAFSTSMSMLPSTTERRSITQQLEQQQMLNSRVPSAMTSLGVANNGKAPPKKALVGQKKPLEAAGSSQPPLSKKPKVAGGFSDQSFDQLNDVTAVSGVNLREEEEQLLSGPKEDSRVSEASRKVVQEEEERLILERIPLQKKLAEIMSKCGVKNKSSEVERCLSLGVEERLRGFITSLIRLSKQRVDLEKPRHPIIVTSDVRQQIMTINRKAREELEKKQSDGEKIPRTDEAEGSNAVDGDDNRGKSSKVNKEEDDKMRTTAANVAARAAVGGDDMLSKWQLMAEQARQKREGGIDVSPSPQPSVDLAPKLVSTSAKAARDSLDAEKRVPSSAVTAPAALRRFGRNQETGSQVRIARTISVKDVISVLQREPQMARSTLIYRLYEKVRTNAAVE